MKTLQALPLPGWRWVLCALVIGVLVSIAIPAYAISGKRWNLPPEYAQELSFDGSGNMWAKSYNPKILSLAPGTDQLTAWSHTNNSIIGANAYGMAIPQTGTSYVWQNMQGMDHVNRLDTSTGQLLSWYLPAGNVCDSRGLAVDSAGTAWFGKNDGKIGHLDAGTNAYEEWPMPISGTYCVNVTGTDLLGPGNTLRVWFCETYIAGTTRKIGNLSPSSGSVAEWTIPGNATFNNCNPPANGKVWFSNSTPFISRLDTVTNELKTWPCQSGCTAVYGVSQETGGKVWFGDATDLLSFEPAANAGVGAFVEYTGLSCSVYYPWIQSANVWTSGSSGQFVCRFDTFP